MSNNKKTKEPTGKGRCTAKPIDTYLAKTDYCSYGEKKKYE